MEKTKAATWKKTLRERLLDFCGYEIWPPARNDPSIHGPQPRILSRRQIKAMKETMNEAKPASPSTRG